MGDVGVPPKAVYKDIPDDVYEVYLDAREETENKFYNPKKHRPVAKTQYMWHFTIRAEGEVQGERLALWTPSYFGRSEKNGLTNLAKLVDPNFDIEVCYPSEEAMDDKFINAPLRVMVKNTPKDNGDVYPKITGFLKSTLKKPTVAELAQIKAFKEDSNIF